jgi:hypothetical protein
MTGINGDHASSVALQETIGKTSRGCADIETGFATYIDLPVIQSALEFKAAATHISQVVDQKAYGSFGVDKGSGFLNFLFIEQHFACENERLGTLAGTHYAAFYQQLVCPDLHLCSKLTYPFRASTRVCAEC